MADNNTAQQDKPLLAITMGDINGIGPELLFSVFEDKRMMDFFTPVVYGHTKILIQYKKILKAQALPFNQIENPREEAQPNKLNLIHCWEEDIQVNPGQPGQESGWCAYKALEKATADAIERKVDGLVTAPINKENIQQADFNFPGHTEFLAEKSGAKDSLMMMVGEFSKIGVVTGHMPLRDVADTLTTELIKQKTYTALKSLRNDFGIKKPKIALTGLNPHAGENGLLGKEDEEIIRPLSKEMRNNDLLVYGPYSADGFFGEKSYLKFDAVLAMYHDQGLIPFKTLEFGQGVNFTAGLPIIRTSPDHGTAYSLAGKGKADPSSMRRALYLACDITKQHRIEEQPV